MRLKSVLFSVVLGVTSLGVVACGGKAKDDGMNNNAANSKSLYDRLGGKDAITAVVGDFLDNVAADATINARFKNADLPGLKQKLIDQICMATGGPCKYTGKTMAEAHAGMQITEAEFNALVGDLTKSLVKYKVGDQEQKDLLGALGGMKGDIVGH